MNRWLKLLVGGILRGFFAVLLLLAPLIIWWAVIFLPYGLSSRIQDSKHPEAALFITVLLFYPAFRLSRYCYSLLDQMADSYKRQTTDNQDA